LENSSTPYRAKLRLPAISPVDRAFDTCRKVQDRSRRIGLPVAFIRMVPESAFFNRATRLVRGIDGFESNRDEMIFERASPSCYSCAPFTALVNHEMPADQVHRAVSKTSGVYVTLFETADRIEQTLPRKLGIGRHVGG